MQKHPAITSHPGVSQAGCGINMYAVSRIDIKLGLPSTSMLVDVRDPMVSFMKSKQAITGTLNKLQIPAGTYT